jgi:hypothetical protein
MGGLYFPVFQKKCSSRRQNCWIILERPPLSLPSDHHQVTNLTTLASAVVMDQGFIRNAAVFGGELTAFCKTSVKFLGDLRLAGSTAS